MGLFSFLKNVGKKRFKDNEVKEGLAKDVINENKAKALKMFAESLKLEVTNIQVSVNDDVVYVSGDAATAADREKLILAVGNVDGVSQVEDRIFVQEQEVEEIEGEFYTVVKGDSLSKIAKQFYGNAMKYPVIFEANKPMLEHPDKIYPGQVLRIPPVVA